ncbi:MAG: PepSY domain-containing protein [Magnetococcus sp. YQC-9]
MKRGVGRFLLLCALFGLSSGSVRADHDDGRVEHDHERARRLVRAGDILPLERILENDAHLRGRRLLEVRLESHRGEWIYEIEVKDEQGRVRELEYDARTGRFIREHEEMRKRATAGGGR